MHTKAEEHLSQADRVLARVIREVGPCKIRPRRHCPPYQSLVQAVTHQQLNGTAAQTILNRFIALFPGEKFPSPASIVAAPEELLRSAGLSRAKTVAIKDIVHEMRFDEASARYADFGPFVIALLDEPAAAFAAVGLEVPST